MSRIADIIRPPEVNSLQELTGGSTAEMYPAPTWKTARNLALQHNDPLTVGTLNKINPTPAMTTYVDLAKGGFPVQAQGLEYTQDTPSLFQQAQQVSDDEKRKQAAQEALRQFRAAGFDAKIQ